MWSVELRFGEGNGNLHQYSCLENPMDRRAWQATVQGVTKSDATEATNTHFSPFQPLLGFPQVLDPSLALCSLKHPEIGDLRCYYGAQSRQQCWSTVP